MFYCIQYVICVRQYVICVIHVAMYYVVYIAYVVTTANIHKSKKNICGSIYNYTKMYNLVYKFTTTRENHITIRKTMV